MDLGPPEMEHPEKKVPTPESPNTHKRIMARNRMRRYRLRQKQNQQARNQAGSMIFSLPPQSPVGYPDVMPSHNIPLPTPMYQSSLIEGYEPPPFGPNGTHMTPQTTPPQMHSMSFSSQQSQSTNSHLGMYPPGPAPPHHGASNSNVHRSAAINSPPHINQGLMPPMPMVPPQHRRDSETAIQALQESLDSLGMTVSRPMSSVVVIQDILQALPMRSDSTEAIEFAARVCKILGIHLS